MRQRRIAALVATMPLVLGACGGAAGAHVSPEVRAGSGTGGIDAPGSTTRLLGPESFPCRPAPKDEPSYTKYGVGPMRRGGLEPEPLEPDHITIDGVGANFHGAARVVDGDTIEMEMDENYFGPTLLRGPAGATVTIELENDGVRAHNFSVPGQTIDVNCGVRAAGEVEVRFPRSGVLAFVCKYGLTSGMRGGLVAAG
jgi:plastocyanin